MQSEDLASASVGNPVMRQSFAASTARLDPVRASVAAAIDTAPDSGSAMRQQAPSTTRPEMALATVDGWPITIATPDDAIAAICDAAERGEGFSAVTLNLDHLVRLRRHEGFRNAYRAARFVTADGAPVARLARSDCPRIVRTAGSDLVVPLAMEAARRALPIYLFGTSADVLAKAGRDLAERSDGKLSIAGSEAPPQGFDPEGPAADAALDRIVASGARLCYIALGAPKQEILAARAVARGLPVGFVSVGASLDFLAGKQVRAPEMLRRHGLEWLWRLATNPRRLALRYAQCAIILADITLLGSLRHRLRPRAT